MVNHDKKDLKILCLQEVTLSPVNLPATSVYLLRGSLQLSQHSIDYNLETKLYAADKIFKIFFVSVDDKRSSLSIWKIVCRKNGRIAGRE